MQFVVRPKTRLMHFASHSTFALRTLTHTKKLHKSRQATRFRNNAKVACRPDLSRSVLGLSWACPGPVPCSSGTKCKTWQLNSSQAEPTQPQSCSWRWSVYLRFLLFLLFFFFALFILQWVRGYSHLWGKTWMNDNVRWGSVWLHPTRPHAAVRAGVYSSSGCVC